MISLRCTKKFRAQRFFLNSTVKFLFADLSMKRLKFYTVFRNWTGPACVNNNVINSLAWCGLITVHTKFYVWLVGYPIKYWMPTGISLSSQLGAIVFGTQKLCSAILVRAATEQYNTPHRAKCLSEHREMPRQRINNNKNSDVYFI